MKNHLKYIIATVVFCIAFAGQTTLSAQQADKVVVGYITSWGDRMPDPSLVTHLNYAFGHVSDSFDGVRIDNPERLRAIVAMKQSTPDVKVMLSIGGWGSGHFSEMAADNNNRNSFARDCMHKIKEYGLDGIDIDWEYPTPTRREYLLHQPIKAISHF